MYRTRLRFSKSGALAFIGHLDFLRVFGQTIRRATLPAAFSQGFNPHLLLSFALPLPLGMESVNDYADLILAEEMPYEEIVKKLNATAPAGLTINAAYAAEDKAAGVVVVADYFVRGVNVCVAQKIEETLVAKEIVVPKKTKKGMRNTDIRPDIFELREEKGGVFMRLSAGSERFLNPLMVADLLFEGTLAANASSVEEITTAAVIRQELYRRGTKRTECVSVTDSRNCEAISLHLENDTLVSL